MPSSASQQPPLTMHVRCRGTHPSQRKRRADRAVAACIDSIQSKCLLERSDALFVGGVFCTRQPPRTLVQYADRYATHRACHAAMCTDHFIRLNLVGTSATKSFAKQCNDMINPNMIEVLECVKGCGRRTFHEYGWVKQTLRNIMRKCREEPLRRQAVAGTVQAAGASVGRGHGSAMRDAGGR